MVFGKDVIFGEITECSADNTLTVKLDNGEIGVVPQDEIGRRAVNANSTFNWMVGRRYGFFASDTSLNGYHVLSSRAYENDCYQRIVDAFNNNERNVYCAHISNVLRDGKVAFFQLAQGVNASLSVHDFALSRMESFLDIDIPKDLTVAIKEITPQGHIRLYAKAAFGDYASSVARLNITVGSVVEGIITGAIPSNNDSVVTLAPNLTVLASPTPLGTWVKVQITRVNHEEQRIKGEIIERMAEDHRRFPYGSFCVDADSFPQYLNIQEFETRIGPKKRVPADNPHPAAPASAKQPEISYVLSSLSSPFVLREGETAIRSPLNNGTPGKILFQSEHGYLTEKHMLAAKAINELRYCTSWQLQRYLHLQHGLALSDNSVSSIMDRLIKLDIINTLHFKLGENISNQPIMFPSSRLYSTYTGAPRSLPTYAYTADLDSAMIKCYLSANQLLLGIMHSGIVESVNNRVNMSAENGTRLRARYKVVTKNGETFYLESSRGSDHEYMLEKLARYKVCLAAAGEHASVIITLENESEIASFVEEVTALQLDFDVMVTCDLHCLPDPIFTTVPAHPPESKENGILSRIKSCIVDPLTAKFMH